MAYAWACKYRMFSLFQIRSIDRLLLLAVFLLLVRMGLWVSNLPYIVPEIPYWLVGEKLLEGSVLYKDILDDCPPLVALLYTGLSFVAERSVLLSTFLATALTFVQALYFNQICIKFGQIDERSYMPAAMYLLLSNACIDFAVLSPPLLALTALLPALSRLYTHIRYGLEEHRVHETGFWIGMAALCYLPSAIFILLFALCFVLYTGTRPRWYAVLGIGFLFPFIVAGFVFYYLDAFSGFVFCYLQAPFTLPSVYAGWGSSLFDVAALGPYGLGCLADHGSSGIHQLPGSEQYRDGFLGCCCSFKLPVIYLAPTGLFVVDGARRGVFLGTMVVSRQESNP
jgi:hypothetical protein